MSNYSHLLFLITILGLTFPAIFSFKPNFRLIPQNELLTNECKVCKKVYCQSKGKKETYFKLNMASVIIPTSTNQKSDLFSYYRFAFRLTWLSWWVQIILTVISSVILTFANTVRQSASTYSIWMSGFAFSTIGVFISFFSCLLTWNNSRKLKRFTNESNEQMAIKSIQKSFKYSVWISLLGMFITLLGAEQIVGTLASKVLSLQGFQPTLGALNQQNSLQALDIFLVQANTNSLLALFSPIVTYLGLQSFIPEKYNINNSTVSTTISNPKE
jgi:hypothetical protein